MGKHEISASDLRALPRRRVFKVADEIVAEGKEPTQRSIRDRLAKGGSFSELGPLLVEWATTRGFRPRLSKDDLPPHLKDKLGALTAEVWQDGLRNGAINAQNDRDRLAFELKVVRQMLSDMETWAEALEATLGALRPGEALPARPGSDIDDDPRFPPNFMARLRQEIWDVLGDRTLDADQILAALSPEIRAEGEARDRNFNTTRLTIRIREKARKGLMFSEPEWGKFCRLPKAA